MELEEVEFSLHDVVTEATRLLAVAASNKGLELICRIAPDAPAEIVGDPNRLRQTIVNMISNAVKFTSAGHVFVDVSVDRRSAGKVDLEFAVQDTGIGIAKDKQDTVFEAFRQSDSSTTRKYGGTGLGLAISTQLVDLMDGRIWLESELGQGSSFHFVIPFHTGPLTAAEAFQLPADAPASALLVSDYACSRGVYAEMLESCGLEVSTASVANAVSAADADARPALIVLDLDAAGQSSPELMDQLTGADAPADRSLVILMPAGRVEAAGRCRDSGRIQCLIKPVKAAELQGALQSLFAVENENGRGPAESPASAELAPLHILVADDSPVNQDVAAGLLGLKGHTVKVADNGREAVEMYQQEAFDLIFMDIEMPELDGIAATARIRELELTGDTHIPIIAMTAHAIKGFADDCVAAGMDGYVTKPVRPDELFAALQPLAEAKAAVAG
jgi:CheY-like chemotaxis protein